uniref:Uncharacterized protein n=1 Tax=Arion vulgaris TaxID=1028688 RepID=A0A0B7AWZ8_9EUPU
MGRKYHVKSLFNYAVFAVAVFFAYKYFMDDGTQRPADPFREVIQDHPKLIKPRPVNKRTEAEKETEQIQQQQQQRPNKVEEKGEETAIKDNIEKIKKEQVEEEGDENNKPQAKIDVGDIPKELFQRNDTLDSLILKEKGLPFQHIVNNQNIVNKKNETEQKVNTYQNEMKMKYFKDSVDWELEEEMAKRRAEFFKSLNAREEQFEPDEFKNLIETHDDITFVTAGSHSTYHATIKFIHSVQYFYPQHKIAIYDIGLTSDERTFIESLCNTVLTSLFLQLWPENLYKIRHRIWRPLLLQFAVVKFGHCVYIEPGRFIYRQLINDYLDRSRVHGVIVGGKQAKHSTYFVTNPYMYTFIATDERKLLKTPHFEFNLIILHNTKRVQHYFMRYLLACTLQEYCITPPGAQPNCDKYGGSKKYGRCHRYDESAINLILNNWHNFSPREYLMKDMVTMNFDGSDMSPDVNVCNNSNKQEV